MPPVIAHAPMESPIGRLWVAVSRHGLVSITRGDLPSLASLTLDPPALAPAIAELEAYFEGRLRDFSLPLDLRDAGAFDAAIWTATRQIPYGETASYGELALMAGHPGAARAAGGSMSRCPLFPVVPCHRVIHADGSIRGWGGDLWIKRWLLDLEQRDYDAGMANRDDVRRIALPLPEATEARRGHGVTKSLGTKSGWSVGGLTQGRRRPE